MSVSSPLHASVVRAFTSAFGEPANTDGHGRHWSLKGEGGCVHLEVLVVGHADHVMVWVIDPSNPFDGVMGEVITTPERGAAVLALIQHLRAHRWSRTP
jgi:hypothetical protein